MKQVKLPPANETMPIKKGGIEYAVIILLAAVIAVAVMVAK